MSRKNTYSGPVVSGPFDGAYFGAAETLIEIAIKAEGPKRALAEPNYDLAVYEFRDGQWIYRSTRKGTKLDQAAVRTARRGDFL